MPPRLLDETNQRPDLAYQELRLPPGQWWSEDGWLRIQVLRVGPDPRRPLPQGWTWVLGIRDVDGHDDYCLVPVRLDALPAPGQGHATGEA